MSKIIFLANMKVFFILAENIILDTLLAVTLPYQANGAFP